MKPRKLNDKYDPPPFPAVGDRVHCMNGPYAFPGEVRAILKEYADHWIIVVRYWNSVKKRYWWECEDTMKWEMGLFRPGPVPKPDKNGRYPWHAAYEKG